MKRQTPLDKKQRATALPLDTRQKKAVRFQLTERDMQVLSALARYRYLRTGQIQRLCFADNTSNQSTQRRLKYLYHHGLVGRIIPLTPMGKGGAEVAYCLDRAGRKLLDDEDITLSHLCH